MMYNNRAAFIARHELGKLFYTDDSLAIGRVGVELENGAIKDIFVDIGVLDIDGNPHSTVVTLSPDFYAIVKEPYTYVRNILMDALSRMKEEVST